MVRIYVRIAPIEGPASRPAGAVTRRRYAHLTLSGDDDTKSNQAAMQDIGSTRPCGSNRLCHKATGRYRQTGVSGAADPDTRTISIIRLLFERYWSA